MNRPIQSMELPPKCDYSGMTPVQRDVLIHFGMLQIQAEFSLFNSTGNGAHMWRCYQLWRRLMPDDLPQPRELLEYFDRCAAGLATETRPEAIKQALGLSKPPGAMAEHGGGPSAETAAEPVRRQQDAMIHVCSKLLQARMEGKTPKGYKTDIYEDAAGKFGYSLAHIKRLVSKWAVAEVVERDFKELHAQQK